MNCIIALVSYLSFVTYNRAQDILCYECASSLFSSSNIQAGCQNDAPCCKDPFDSKYPSSPPLVKRCTTGVCLKTTYFWDYKYRNNTFFERLCYDKAYISRLIAPGSNWYNKAPTTYELTKAEEAERALRKMECALAIQETPSGRLHARICPCNTDYCNSAIKNINFNLFKYSLILIFTIAVVTLVS